MVRCKRLERAKGDGDEALDRCFRSQILGGTCGVNAEFGQGAGRCVVSHAAVFRGVGDESLDEVFDMTLGVGDVFAVVDQGCELGLMVAASLVDVESVGCEDRLEPLTGCGRLGISSPVCPYVRRNTFPGVSVILEMSSATEKASEVPHRSLVLERIRSRHGSLIPSEARVAERILADPEAVMYQSVTQLAGSAETSLSTVVRFCRSIGLSGFQDLKLALGVQDKWIVIGHSWARTSRS